MVQAVVSVLGGTYEGGYGWHAMGREGAWQKE